MTDEVVKVKKPKRPIKRIPKLTETEKAEAIALWKAGAVTLKDLSKKFGRTGQTFITLFKTSGAVKGSTAAAMAKKITEEVEKAVLNDAAVYAKRIKDTKEEHYSSSVAISKIVMATLVRARSDGIPYGNTINDLKAFKVAAETLKITREERYITLGITSADDAADRPLPDLMIQELNAEDIEEMSRQNRVSDDGEFDMDEMGDESLLVDEDRVETD